MRRKGRSRTESSSSGGNKPDWRDSEDELERVKSQLRQTAELHEISLTELKIVKEASNQFEAELKDVKAQLLTTNEQYQNSIEELKTTNEELHTTAEELQATNEELRATTEELESNRDALLSLNIELEKRVTEVSRSNNDLKNLMYATNIATVFLARDLSIKRYTPRATDIFNLIPADIGRPLIHITNRLDYKNLTADIEQSYTSLQHIEREVSSHDGRYFIARLFPYLSPSNHLDGVVLTFLDITERKKMEQALSEQKRFTQQIAELTPVVINVFDLETNRDTYISPDVAGLLGYTSEEIIQMEDSITTLWHQEDIPQAKAKLELVKGLKDDDSTEFEYRVRRRDGKLRWLASRAMPFERNENGEVLQLVSASWDITEQKQTNERLRASEEQFRRYFELGLIGMAITSPSKGFIEINDEMCRILGYGHDELIQIRWEEITHPDDLVSDVADFNRVMSGEIEGYSMDKRWIRKDGRIVHSIISVKAVRGFDGSIDHLVALLQDITERKEAEEALRRAKEELEDRVAERTADLNELNTQLQMEIADRRRIEEERIELLRRIITVQEDERGRIARDLHDEMGQYLSALILGLDSLKNPSSKMPVPVDAQIERLEKLARKIDGEVNRLTFELRPLVLDDLGLVVALRQHAENWSHISGVEIAFSSTGVEDTRLATEVEIALYRVVQEALTNVAKHAAASHVSLILQHKSNQHVTIIIEDDGAGFDEEEISQGSSHRRFGLAGMRTRLFQVGGTFEIESAKGKGTTIFARVPILITNAQISD